MSKQWYVVHAYSQYENSVKRSLIEYIGRKGLEEYFGEILVPTEEVVEIKDGQRRTTERKFFPGYVLVNMELTDETWHLVKSVPKVMGFIGGSNDKPTPLSEAEAANILNQIDDSVEKPRPKTLFEAGQAVRITDGPFADFNGVVEVVDYEKSRLRVSVLIFGRSTPVDLEFAQVEKA